MFDYIRLERTMCYGNCPVYNVIVDKEGNVKYEGEMFVYKSGEYQWKISNKKVKQLRDLIENFGFKSYIYKPLNGFVTDQPSCITTVKYSDGDSKEIDHYYGDILIDNRLTDFEKKIESIIGTKKYANPKLYIYEVTEKVSEPPCRYLVISASKEEAINLVNKESDIEDMLEWQVNKIGIATDDYYGSVIIMKGI
ncbi:hypothetical protein BD780_003506 [Clostridium tetanomorphum]|uniref:DUF6438 domain-containing protein n=1 Tax=Clostridium tetanomorphum TaxID=1553 RepID=UPI000448BBD5|nr:DUF6438 domain-containing protein [Clostridium tetanomorphum]KAJ49367.1 hypothetical protein CTM_23404 [Clostridium tetanomorphum DSM 665]KAJ51206.1 hypothetical protein CTM_13838 [Clostridium tetanomorphum DSM 665]MBP1863705.1 hypothetical protein [Clostridium tetanomorphum]NRS86281.1 hypothetical protein [Clostridium tetanomorphum]SQC00711.1 Uncharacterised protein [Clostridium tetanomorphum]